MIMVLAKNVILKDTFIDKSKDEIRSSLEQKVSIFISDFFERKTEFNGNRVVLVCLGDCEGNVDFDRVPILDDQRRGIGRIKFKLECQKMSYAKRSIMIFSNFD